jgi:hypothetical protein
MHLIVTEGPGIFWIDILNEAVILLAWWTQNINCATEGLQQNI